MNSDLPIDRATFVEAERQAALDSYAILDTPAEQAYDDIVRLARTVCDTPVAAVTFIDRERLWFKARSGIEMEMIPRTESLCDHAIRSPREALIVPDLNSDARFSDSTLHTADQPLRFYTGVPLLSPDGHALGALCVMDTEPRTLEPAQLDALSALARQTQHLLELRRHSLEQRRMLAEHIEIAQRLESVRQDLQRRHDDLQYAASRDPLTGLLNRAALAQLRNGTEGMQRLGNEVYVMLVLDIDHFKQVNDRHGHLLGDRAIRAVADKIAASIRDADVAVRYGGEEFLVVLPGTLLSAGFEVAERIRERMTEVDLPFSITVSIGIADGDPRYDLPESVFDRADQALYRAKTSGRNRVVADDTQRMMG